MKISIKKSLLRFIACFMIVCTLIGAMVSLTGCSGSEVLYLFNYGDYIDPEVYDLFEQEYGIKVVYDEYAAPEDMYSKFTSGTAKYDLICTSDYMLEKLIKEDLLAKVNFDNVSN